MTHFYSLFKLHNNNQSPNAKKYILGLLKDGLRNKSIERIVESESQYNYQAIQYFLSEAQWDYQKVFSKVAKLASESFKNKNDTGLILDETTFTKKGKHSVGVARQYLGTVGKIDNGQMGVFASLCNDTDRTIIDGQLYLPKEWTDDIPRMVKAKIPEENQVFKTKEDIVLDILERAKENKINYKWIGGDAGYGKNMPFLHTLDDLMEMFVIDVQKKIKVYLKEPSFSVPKHKGKGPVPKIAKPNIESIRLDKFATSIDASSWQRLDIREGTKGIVSYEYYFKQIYLYDHEKSISKKYHLILRREPGKTNEYKYTLSNAAPTTPKKRLAYMQAQRYWVERSFQDAKQSCGMKDYQVRTWIGWHHHMALVSMATLFIMKEKMFNREETPLMSCTDVSEIITFFLAQKVTSEKVLVLRIRQRHKQRLADIIRRQKKRIHIP